MLPTSIYAYIWRTTRRSQLLICLLTAVLAPISMVPLEIQRRIVDEAIGKGEFRLVALLALGYLAVIVIQNAFKYVLNLLKGRILEDVAKDLRIRILTALREGSAPEGGSERRAIDDGTIVSVLVAEADDVGGFASQSVSVPLLQTGTILFVTGYLIWVQPYVAILAVLLYLPQAFAVRRIQDTINRLSRMRTNLVRRLGKNAIEYNEAAPDRARTALRRARGNVGRVYSLRMRVYRWKYLLTLIGNVVDALGPIIILAVGGYLVIAGETEVSTIVVFISGFQRLADPWNQLVTFYRSVSISRVSYELIAKLLMGQPVAPVLATEQVSAVLGKPVAEPAP